jgi:ubiquitin thioesterase protein OTUB1
MFCCFLILRTVLLTCAWIAVGFAYIENLIQSPDRDLAVVTSVSTLETAKPMMDKSGFMSIVYEDPYEIFESLVKNVANPGEKGEILDVPLLLSAFQHYEGKIGLPVEPS